MTRSTTTTAFHLIVAIVWATSAGGSEMWKTETNTKSLDPSSHVQFQNIVTPTATEFFGSSNTEDSPDKLTTSHDTKPLSTVSFSIATSRTNTEITTAPSSTPVATTEPIQTSAESSMAESLTATAHIVNATQLAQEADTSVLNAEAVLNSLDTTHYHSLETGSWFHQSSDAEIESTLAHNYSTLIESTAAWLWHPSSAIENQTSATVRQITPSQHAGATTSSTSSPKSVTDRPAAATTTKTTTTVSKIALHNSAEDLAPGAKIAIGVTVTLCVLGVILASVVLYRRFNITHRSLKSFLTSGVRYKTYKNATYKDDEGMLIMPDRH